MEVASWKNLTEKKIDKAAVCSHIAIVYCTKIFFESTIVSKRRFPLYSKDPIKITLWDYWLALLKFSLASVFEQWRILENWKVWLETNRGGVETWVCHSSTHPMWCACALRLHSSRQSIFFLAVLGRRLKISASRAVKVKVFSSHSSSALWCDTKLLTNDLFFASNLSLF